VILIAQATIRDIAEKAGTSITTVSLVLNGKELRISSATKKRIIDIANQLNYRPNRLAVGLITKKTSTLGLLLPDISNSFFGELAKGAEDKASENNYNIILSNTNDNPDKDLKYLEILLDRGVDGVIMVPSSVSAGEILKKCCSLMEQCQKPFVLLDRIKIGDKYSSVAIDHELGGYLATKYLIENGHKKIACITGPLGMLNSRLRFIGFKKALEEAKIPYNHKYVKEGNYHVEDGELLVEDLFQQKVTAIFAFNDLMAYGVYKAARKFGYKIPEDISIVGFDDLFYSGIMEVPLTTIRQPSYKMGEASVSKLIDLINTPQTSNESILFQPELVIRNSVINIVRNP
jgi:LacI family transcriptional regulator